MLIKFEIDKLSCKCYILDVKMSSCGLMLTSLMCFWLEKCYVNYFGRAKVRRHESRVINRLLIT